jgi:hypothetical protein
MLLSSFLTICGLALNAIGAFIMLRWPIYANAICLDSNDKKWKEAGGFLNSKVVPPWKVFRARSAPGSCFSVSCLKSWPSFCKIAIRCGVKRLKRGRCFRAPFVYSSRKLTSNRYQTSAFPRIDIALWRRYSCPDLRGPTGLLQNCDSRRQSTAIVSPQFWRFRHFHIDSGRLA